MSVARTADGWLASPAPHARPICAQICVGQKQCAAQNSELFGGAVCFLRAVTKDGETVSDVREDQSIDQSRQKVGRDLMTHVGQRDENTVAFFDDSRHVRVPGEVLVEHDAKVPHRGALTDHVLAQPNGDGI